MRRVLPLLAVGFVLAAQSLTAVPAGAVVAPWVIAEDTTLTEDFAGWLQIKTNGITLDCASHVIRGVPDNDYGAIDTILVSVEASNVTVQNCVLDDGFHGVFIYGSNNSITNNTISDGAFGVWIIGDSNTLQQNTITAMEGHGIVLQNGTGNAFADNTVDGAETGLKIEGEPGNTVVGNTFINGSEYGIVDYSWYENTYEANVCTGNGIGNSDPAWICDNALDGPFVDDDDSLFQGDIEWAAWNKITVGCNPPDNTKFCPNDPVTRGEMAVFLVRALDSTPYPLLDQFIDDDDLFYEASANSLFKARVTKGCNPPTSNLYCGERNVTRGEMAAFLARAFDLAPYHGPDRFVDDDNSIFENAIEKLAHAGITVGCNPPDSTRFCPNDHVTRGQMAAFLKRALS